MSSSQSKCTKTEDVCFKQFLAVWALIYLSASSAAYGATNTGPLAYCCFISHLHARHTKQERKEVVKGVIQLLRIALKKNDQKRRKRGQDTLTFCLKVLHSVFPVMQLNSVFPNPPIGRSRSLHAASIIPTLKRNRFSTMATILPRLPLWPLRSGINTLDFRCSPADW